MDPLSEDYLIDEALDEREYRLLLSGVLGIILLSDLFVVSLSFPY
jgi:hypothetical protein